MKSNLQKRIFNLRAKVAIKKLQSFLITEPNNISYLTGETELSHDWRDSVLVLTQKTCLLLISPLRKKRDKLIPKLIRVKNTNDFFTEIRAFLTEQKITTLGFEQENLRVSEFRELKGLLRPICLKPTAQLVEKLRMIKDEREIDNIKKACQIAVSVHKKIKKFLTPGKTEKEVAWRIERLLVESGADGVPKGFRPIVAFGSNTAIPHHLPTQKRLGKRDLALLDFGCTYKAYTSDFTRVIPIGKPTDLQIKVSKIVKNARKRALDMISKTNNSREIDKAARDLITKSGYEKFFIHGTGHGLGLSIHEAPSINHTEKTEILEGMVFTIEPGIYLPGKFGIRHEDVILKTKEKYKILTEE
jgi:Xaa-Pro aminopeptidase